MKHLPLLPLLFALGCTSPPGESEPAEAPAEPTEARKSAPEEAPSEPVADGFVEPEPTPWGDGRAGWRQEAWWEVRRLDGEGALVVYKVAKVYGLSDYPRPMGRPWLHPRPPEAWLQARCPRCSHDANPAAQSSDGGVVLDFDDVDEERSLGPPEQERVAGDFRRAAGDWPADATIQVDEDGWVWVNAPRATHDRVMGWLRSELCPHGR